MTYTPDQLPEILVQHRCWLAGEGGSRANLSRAVLIRADLRGADLRGADLRDANLRGADLRDANLRGADLRRADLGGADLRDANLRGADLSDADLSGADLRWANLGDANLSETRGLLDPVEYLLKTFEQTPDGVIVYKTFGGQYPPNPDWRVEPGSIIEEVVNPDRACDCACGVNVATLDWVRGNYPGKPVWKCLIRWPWLVGVVVPYHTDGKIRASRVELLEIVGGDAA